MKAFDYLQQVIADRTTDETRRVALKSFATALDWTPHSELRERYQTATAISHLVVEHGIENAAALTFLAPGERASELSASQIEKLLEISYNNLIDWHIFISNNDVRIVNNLSFPDVDNLYSIREENISDVLSVTGFNEISRNEKIKKYDRRCDEVVINVIARWKKIISSEIPNIDNKSLSSIFNAMIFVRACEDQKRQDFLDEERVLLAELSNSDESKISEILRAVLRKFEIMPDDLNFIDWEDVNKFDILDKYTVENLFIDFYRPRSVSYNFNFALMSKHALSRIYEKYISLLYYTENEKDSQISFLPTLPSVAQPEKSGSVFTPQYIASFFSRYLRDNTPPRRFRQLKVIDPACGSGIFLRTVLEHQASPLDFRVDRTSIDAAFANIYGIDRDPNACSATRLSLALLHLVITDEIPSRPLQISNTDALDAFLNREVGVNSFDAVIANPPYIKLDHLNEADRDKISNVLGDLKEQRVDSYLAFVAMAMHIARPGGFVCLVLPQAFLSSRNASKVRSWISKEFTVRLCADLSSLDVFSGVGAYTLLLILEKVGPRQSQVRATIAKIADYVGPALQACLDGRAVDTPYYSVFDVEQDYFDKVNWVLLSPEENRLDRLLNSHKTLSVYMSVKQGFVTGADKVFIRSKKDIPLKERAVWLDYLKDREISRYELPKNVNSVVFFPFQNGKPLEEKELKELYPKSYEYLLSHKGILEKRGAVSRHANPWWRPVRPRGPDVMCRPKIVCPHLMLVPRFGIDRRGSFAVSHTPMVLGRDADDDNHVLLNYFAAVLNSSVARWYLNTHAPRYSKGYVRIEVASLKAMPVPNPKNVPISTLKTISDKIDDQNCNEKERQIELDEIISDLFGLDIELKRYLNVGD
ncbi:N-6 DNA methylase [Hyphobacterium sp. CCMP332]|uniref:Eco57I restriction-modification methylase domain-containing protein n=1 Tax=Hyphobacterium sp. CCMP332 TaxID=2749086 RepID=UPI00164F71D6|nr:N-6 DNA methylase [Hyphobacterium sp. CCMP332]QNL18190.1 N-6 DNA methylase [Hyphobacterium sp. CCMP332]